MTTRKLDSLPPSDVNRTPVPGWKPWVYLASGLGFSASDRELVLPKLVAAVEGVGCSVFEPFTTTTKAPRMRRSRAPIGHTASARAMWRLCAAVTRSSAVPT